MSELKEQRYIIEIAKVQGVAKAAENLFISQPALSKFSVNSLQEQKKCMAYSFLNV